MNTILSAINTAIAWMSEALYSYILIIVLVGAGLEATFLWNLADVLMGLLALINIPVIILLGKYALRALADYRMKKKTGRELTFRAKDIDLPHDVEEWN